MKFNDEQGKRYSRHIILDHVGMEGQLKIAQAKILVIGAGGLGSAILFYLAAAGVGTIGIVDGDVVDLANLQRQIVHITGDVGKAKVESAARKLRQINPNVRVNTYNEFATSKNILDLIRGYDFVVDGTDNFQAKFLINDACVLAGKPFSHAGVLQFEGQIMTVIPDETACYRCVFQEPPPPNIVPSCSQAGVLGALPGIFGTMQAAEALKYVIGQGNLLTDRLLIGDVLRMEFREVEVKKRPECLVCGENPTIKTLADL